MHRPGYHNALTDSSTGVATAAFRKASNGAKFLHRVRDEIGIKIFIISQEQEATMGFLTACATSSSELMAQEIVSWDSGGGSFQLAGQWENSLQTWLRSNEPET